MKIKLIAIIGLTTCIFTLIVVAFVFARAEDTFGSEQEKDRAAVDLKFQSFDSTWNTKNIQQVQKFVQTTIIDVYGLHKELRRSLKSSIVVMLLWNALLHTVIVWQLKRGKDEKAIVA